MLRMPSHGIGLRCSTATLLASTCLQCCLQPVRSHAAPVPQPFVMVSMLGTHTMFHVVRAGRLLEQARDNLGGPL